jgi:P-type Mg2+ transporter
LIVKRWPRTRCRDAARRGRRRRPLCWADDVLARLRTGSGGLPEAGAARRLAVTGPNVVRTHRTPALQVLASQLRSPLLLLLAVTALASAFLGQASDAIIIAVILAASA